MTRILFTTAAIAAMLLTPLGAESLPTSKPEEVGLSSVRLKRVHEMVLRRVEAKEISGAVTIVARRGRVVQHDAVGVQDLDSKQPMTKETLFRLLLHRSR